MPTSAQQLAFAIKAVNEAQAVLKDVQNDIKGVGDQAGTAAGPTSRFGTSLGDVGKIAGGFVVAQGLTQLPGLLTGMAGAAAADEAATMRLEQALRNQGGAFDENLRAVNDRIKGGQDLAFTDDQIRDSFQILLAATGDVTESLDRQKVAMDFARGAGIPLEQASRLLGKVTAENVEVFKRMGITIGEGATEAEALAVIQGKFGGQADAYANSTAGQFERAKIQMSELKEQIGGALIPIMGTLAGSLDFVITNFDKFLPLLAGAAAGALTLGIALLVSLWPSIVTTTASVWAFTAALLANPMTWVVIGIGLLVAAIVLLIQHWDWITEKVPFLGVAFDAVKTVVTDYLIPALSSLWGFIQDYIWPALNTLINVYLYPLELAFNLVRDAVGFAKDHFDDFKGALDLALDPIQWVIDKINGLKDAITNLPSMPDLTPGFSLPSFGFATGAWNVPGPRGAGDVVPAMLSPGEMVIPTSIADRVRDGGGGGWGTQIIQLVVDGAVLAEVVSRQNAQGRQLRAMGLA